MGEAYVDHIILYQSTVCMRGATCLSSIKMSKRKQATLGKFASRYSDGQGTCAYQYVYTVHEVFIVHTHRCNLLLFTHEKCDNEV